MRGAFAILTLWLLAMVACTANSPDGPDSSGNSPRAVQQNASATKSSGSKRACAGEGLTNFQGNRIAVRLRIVPCRLPVGDAPRAVLINIGEGTLGYGFGFELEHRSDRGWRLVNRRQAFPLPLFYLDPRERSDPESLAVYFDDPTPVDLRPGHYRVTKGVDLTPGKPRPRTIEAKATFRVVQP